MAQPLELFQIHILNGVMVSSASKIRQYARQMCEGSRLILFQAIVTLPDSRCTIWRFRTFEEWQIAAQAARQRATHVHRTVIAHDPQKILVVYEVRTMLHHIHTEEHLAIC